MDLLVDQISPIERKPNQIIVELKYDSKEHVQKIRNEKMESGKDMHKLFENYLDAVICVPTNPNIYKKRARDENLAVEFDYFFNLGS